MSTAGHSRAQSIQSEASPTNAPISTTDPTKPSASAAAVTSISGKFSGKSPARIDQPSESTSPSTPEESRNARQVIAVSASKGPAAFFNLSRKFLVTDEEVDLSALEGAIVSAVDAAHLLERSKLATIVRVQTSYVSVEPKRRKAPRSSSAESPSSAESGPRQPSGEPPVTPPAFSLDPSRARGAAGPAPATRELRRSRIIITMRRTDSYRQWLEDNPLQALAGGGEEDDEDAIEEERIVEEAPSPSL